jgi:hypothetical protein
VFSGPSDTVAKQNHELQPRFRPGNCGLPSQAGILDGHVLGTLERTLLWLAEDAVLAEQSGASEARLHKSPDTLIQPGSPVRAALTSAVCVEIAE